MAAAFPDGPVVDAEGCLVEPGSMTAGACRRYDPKGKLIRTVRFPTANVTKMCFGGPGLKTAYATTARKGLDAAALAQQADAGNLFAFDPGVAGLPVTPARITGLDSKAGVSGPTTTRPNDKTKKDRTDIGAGQHGKFGKRRTGAHQHRIHRRDRGASPTIGGLHVRL